MAFFKKNISAEDVFSLSPIIPVLQIDKIEYAIPIAEALFSGGIHILEITLRNPLALTVLELLVTTYPEAMIGAGTVTTELQLDEVVKIGAKFAFSPGLTNHLLKVGQTLGIPFIPGVGSVSDVMAGLEQGYTHFKLFPAVSVGGISMLHSIYNPFPHVSFCPTGGINASNFNDFLSLPNVLTVGGSWLVPTAAVKENRWEVIQNLSVSALKKVNSIKRD